MQLETNDLSVTIKEAAVFTEAEKQIPHNVSIKRLLVDLTDGVHVFQWVVVV